MKRSDCISCKMLDVNCRGYYYCKKFPDFDIMELYDNPYCKYFEDDSKEHTIDKF